MTHEEIGKRIQRATKAKIKWATEIGRLKAELQHAEDRFLEACDDEWGDVTALLMVLEERKKP